MNKILSWSLWSSIFLISPTFAQKIFLLKQWHLPPKIETIDIELSKKLSQYANQKDLFDKSSNLIKDQGVNIVLSEGCEKIEIDKTFSLKFNGWSFSTLDKIKNQVTYKDVLTLLPLKVEVQFGDKVKTLCVDNNDLIKKSQLTLSDIRAYIGYASRLEEFKLKKDQSSYERFAKSLLSAEQISKKLDALQVAKEMALKAVTQFEDINQEREKSIIHNILSLKLAAKDKVALIIGGVHVEKLAEQLKQQKWDVEIYTPSGYVEQDKGLLEEVKRKLQ